MIESLVVALIWIAVIVVIAYVVIELVKKAGVPQLVHTLIWAAVALLALLILLDAAQGGGGLRSFNL